MSEIASILQNLKSTPELHAFVHAELQQVVTFEDPSGLRWNPHKIAAEIAKTHELPTVVSDDTIARFLRGKKINKTSLSAIAGFLLIFDFITPTDLEGFANPGYVRAASALSQMFEGHTDRELANAVAGVYADYRMVGRARLLENVVTLSSPNVSSGVSAHIRRALIRLNDPEFFLSETGNLDPASFRMIPGLLRESDDEMEATTTASGIAVTATRLFTVLFGGPDPALHETLTVSEVHFLGACVTGLRAIRSTDWIRVPDGMLAASDTPHSELTAMRSWLSALELYPQEREVQKLPKIAGFDRDPQNAPRRRTRLNFQSPAALEMDEKEKQNLVGEELEMEIEAALKVCSNPTERLVLAIDLLRADHATQAVNNGADINALHPKTKVPLLHAAASLGMRGPVRAMLARDDCDLTVRDVHGRLASTCANNSAEDFELAAELAEAQTAQFRAKGIDPRSPNVPGYGSYILSRDNE
tara:strand:+ start:16390 stop:17811 length:1422 start_codon:yes stop_codon:yes gene_type:complete